MSLQGPSSLLKGNPQILPTLQQGEGLRMVSLGKLHCIAQWVWIVPLQLVVLTMDWSFAAFSIEDASEMRTWCLLIKSALINSDVVCCAVGTPWHLALGQRIWDGPANHQLRITLFHTSKYFQIQVSKMAIFKEMSPYLRKVIHEDFSEIKYLFVCNVCLHLTTIFCSFFRKQRQNLHFMLSLVGFCLTMVDQFIPPPQKKKAVYFL